MATSQTNPVTKDKKPRAQVKLAERIKGQLTNGVLRNQLTAEELTALGDFLRKLQAVLA